jgi:hypothetical protein
MATANATLARISLTLDGIKVTEMHGPQLARRATVWCCGMYYIRCRPGVPGQLEAGTGQPSHAVGEGTHHGCGLTEAQTGQMAENGALNLGAAAQ